MESVPSLAAARALQMAADGAGAERRRQCPCFSGEETEAPRGGSSEWWGWVGPSLSDARTSHCLLSLFPSLIDPEAVFAPGGAQPSSHVSQSLGVTVANVALAVFLRTCSDKRTTVTRGPASQHQQGRDVDGIRVAAGGGGGGAWGVCPPASRLARVGG